MTSQSGRSCEVIAVAERFRGVNRPALFLGTTNGEASPLADASDIVLALHGGDEATVSTKSYLNALASHAVDVGLRLAKLGHNAGAIGSALCVRRV